METSGNFNVFSTEIFNQSGWFFKNYFTHLEIITKTDYI